MQKLGLLTKMIEKKQPLLSISIPTFERSSYLKTCLYSLKSSERFVASGDLEILIFDNASSDNTQQVVADANADSQKFQYFRHENNIGSDLNFATCYNSAKGKFVLVLGDDDIITLGTISKLLEAIRENEDIGLIYLRPYAFKDDAEKEKPWGGRKENRTYSNVDFLKKYISRLTFVSSLVLNKKYLKVDAKEFSGGNLVQVHLALSALTESEVSVVLAGFSVAAIRSSSPDFDYTAIFVNGLNSILDQHFGQMRDLLPIIKRRSFLRTVPQLALRQRLVEKNKLHSVAESLEKSDVKSWDKYLYFPLIVRPILIAPYYFAVIYGALSVAFIRLFEGGIMLGLKEFRVRFLRLLVTP